jgi:hypothetical protein
MAWIAVRWPGSPDRAGTTGRTARSTTAPARCSPDDWDGTGQRPTASGTTELDNLLVHPDEIWRRDREPAQRPTLSPFLQLFLAAVEADRETAVVTPDRR